MSISSSPVATTTSATDISTQICQALQVTQPDLDTSIGTPTRKMIDAISAAIAGAYIDQYFLDYQYDITSLTGTALDDFVNIFGFTRFAATRATGVATFSRPTPATAPITIMAGTSIGDNSSPANIFTTVTTATMPIGSVSVDIPIISQTGGSNSNVAANSITNFQTSVGSISNVTNLAATSGGNDAESDEALITRFENTVFRNLAGTEQQYMGTALENASCTAANVIGPYKTFTEQIQITNGVGQSSVQSAKYIWPSGYAFGADIGAGEILAPGVNYTFDPNTHTIPDPVTNSFNANLTATVENLDPYQTVGGFGTFNFKIAFANDNGLTLPSASVSATTTSSEFIQLTWTAPPNSTWAYIYFNNPTVNGSYSAWAVVPAQSEIYDFFDIQTVSISSVSLATPPVITTSSNHGFQNGQRILIEDAGGSTSINGEWTIQWISNTSFSINAVVTAAYTGGGYAVSFYNESPYELVPATTNTTGLAPTIYSGTLPGGSADDVNCPDGIYELQFNYTPVASRNDPGNLSGTGAVTNKVDIYVAGQEIETATDTVVFNLQPTFSPTISSPYFYSNFRRPDGSPPTIGNYFIQLSSTPVTQLPSNITLAALGQTQVSSSGYQRIGNTIIVSDAGTSDDVGAQTYTLGVDYFLVNNVTPNGGGPSGLSGLEFVGPNGSGVLPSGNPPPPGLISGTPSLASVTYNYNALPMDVTQSVENWRLLTQDVEVHQVINKYLNINLVVVLSNNSSAGTVQPLIFTAIQNIFSTLSFDSEISTSAILTAVGNVTGVSMVRFTTSSDNANNYAIQEYTADGGYIQTYSYNTGGVSRATDVYMNDDEVPVLNNVNVILRAVNTFQNGS